MENPVIKAGRACGFWCWTGDDPVIVATKRPDHDAPQTCRKRWSIKVMFANSRTGGLNFKDTKLTPRFSTHVPYRAKGSKTLVPKNATC